VVTAWPEPVERVSSFLRDTGAEARIEEFDEETPTAADAAAAVGCQLDQIVKSLVFLCDGRPAVALVPGDRRADATKVAAAAGADRARVASADEVEAATGFTPGAVAPFPLPRVDTVLLDRSLLAKQLLWVGGGSVRHLVGLSPSELSRLTKARPVDVVSEPTYHSTEPKER
jgi:prolyl-tRNA editing enzyme YbaK/EbsC (Cys-tRNA(Pro) deacylase)